MSQYEEKEKEGGNLIHISSIFDSGVRRSHGSPHICTSKRKKLQKHYMKDGLSMPATVAVPTSFITGLLITFTTSTFKAIPLRCQMADGQITLKSTIYCAGGSVLQSDMMSLKENLDQLRGTVVKLAGIETDSRKHTVASQQHKKQHVKRVTHSKLVYVYVYINKHSLTT